MYFHKEGEHLVSVPASWTDIVAEDPVVRVAAGRALFRALDLIELAQMLKGLRSRNVKGITSCVYTESCPGTLLWHAIGKLIYGRVGLILSDVSHRKNLTIR